MVWWSFLIAAAALKTPTRNGYNAQGIYLKFRLSTGLAVETGRGLGNMASPLRHPL